MVLTDVMLHGGDMIGAVIGDIVGSIYEWGPNQNQGFSVL